MDVLLELVGLLVALLVVWMAAVLIFTLMLIGSFLVGRGPLLPKGPARFTASGPGWRGDVYCDGSRELRVLRWRRRWPA